MSVITEASERVAPAVDGRTCDAICTFFGIEVVCGEPAAGLFRRACVHEHVDDGWLCRDHADTPENGLCLNCYELPGGASHDCPINLAEVTVLCGGFDGRVPTGWNGSSLTSTTR